MTHPRRNVRTVAALGLLVVAMFCVGYAMVPLYNVLCKTFGINGKTNEVAVAEGSSIDKSRTVTVFFLATRNENLPWKFYPEIKRLEIHPGENARVAYYAENETDQSMTVQAVPSVSPANAAKYLRKTECFCFTQQTLGPHQKMDMPLLFHLDTALPKNIQSVALSYTLFDVTQMKHKTNGKKQGRIG